jgi:hypothetical protein
MDYSPLNAAFYNINEVQEQQELEELEHHDYEKYINMYDGSRFGQTGNTENLIPGYTGGINSHGYLDTKEQINGNEKEHFNGNGKEHFNGNEHFDGHNYWNGQVIRNGINSNIPERFTSDNANCKCNCKHNTFLLYLCILLIVILYFKK